MQRAYFIFILCKRKERSKIIKKIWAAERTRVDPALIDFLLRIITGMCTSFSERLFLKVTEDLSTWKSDNIRIVCSEFLLFDVVVYWVKNEWNRKIIWIHDCCWLVTRLLHSYSPGVSVNYWCFFLFFFLKYN